MPRHQVNEARLPLRDKPQFFRTLKTVIARLVLFFTTLTLSAYGINEMYRVLSTNHITQLQMIFLVLFSVNFIWIAFSFAQALLGFVMKITPIRFAPKETTPTFQTAILLPIYHENPAPIIAAVKAMRESLAQLAPKQYAFFILSDSQGATAWLNETHAFINLFEEQNAECPVYYRRRAKNEERKVGNIAQWVSQWGSAYEAMLILDADSLMSAESIIRLTRRLAAAPGVGLIQTLPKIIGATSLYGKLQQFANHCYGPIYAEGLAAWHGNSSNFWGHNAIIRTQAFAQACSLPHLKGSPPFGGPVLSHDFIEAAFLRRAGWGVRFDTDITGSFEAAPPSLIDILIRDRRWCQGNLQHSRFLLAKHFHLATRVHLLSGIMGYLSAVLWLMLIIVGLAIAVQAKMIRPEYFGNPSLFPIWPVFDAERAQRLFMLSMGVVLAPKIFGWFSALVHWRTCLGFGGPILLTVSVLIETLLAALYAPIMMVAQANVVWRIIKGKDSGWNPQSRDDGAISWRHTFKVHRKHTLFGIALASTAYLVSFDVFLWLLPITSGLILSIPLSWLSGGSLRAKIILLGGFLLRAPEEKRCSPIVQRYKHFSSTLPAKPFEPSLLNFAQNQTLQHWHLAQLPLIDGPRTGEFHAATITADWKVEHANDPVQLQSWLTPEEDLAILSHDALCKKTLKPFYRSRLDAVNAG